MTDSSQVGSFLFDHCEEILNISVEEWDVIDPRGRHVEAVEATIDVLLEAIADNLQVDRESLSWCITKSVVSTAKANKIAQVLNNFQGQSIDGPEDVQAITRLILNSLHPR